MDNRSVRPSARTVIVAVLAIGAATLASSNLARGDDDPPAGQSAADDGTRPVAEPRQEPRPALEDPASGDTQAAATEGSVQQKTPAAEGSVPTVQMENPADGQIVCRYYRPLGTRIQKRVCATAKEWGERSARDRKDVDDFARQAREAASQPPPAGTTPGRTPL